jgi:hypothetical protein
MSQDGSVARMQRRSRTGRPDTRAKENTMIRVQTPLVLQGLSYNHAEALVTTPVVVGSLTTNHAETLVTTPVVVQSLTSNHAETLVRR